MGGYRALLTLLSTRSILPFLRSTDNNSPRYAQKRFYDFAYDSGFDLYGLRDTECCIYGNRYYQYILQIQH